MTRISHEPVFSLMPRYALIAVIAVVLNVVWQEIQYQVQPEREVELKRGREDVIRADLYTMRSCIDQHLADKGYYPESLQSLVDEGYLRSIPTDPYSGTAKGVWKQVFAEPDEIDVHRDEPGDRTQVVDIRYANVAVVALDGTPIHSW